MKMKTIIENFLIVSGVIGSLLFIIAVWTIPVLFFIWIVKLLWIEIF